MDKKIFFLLCGLSIIAFFLRIYLFPDNLFFGPEQGRDFKVIRDIVVSHKLTLIGSKTDIAGVFHGPVFYYLACIPFILSSGDPYFVSLFFILFQSLSVFLIYFLSIELSSSRWIGIVSALLFTFSYGSISYARWLSNPPLTIPLSLLFFLFLIKFLKGNKWYLIGASVFFGLMGQAEFINFVLAGAVGLAIAIRFYPKFISQSKIYLVLAFFIALLFSIGTYVLFDVRHEFLITKSVLELIGGTKGEYISLVHSINSTFRMLVYSSMNILGLPNVPVTIVTLICIISTLILRVKRNSWYLILIFWLATPIIVLILLRHDVLEQLFVFLAAGIIIGLAVAIDFVRRFYFGSVAILLLVIFLFFNVSLIYGSLPVNSRIFFQSTQPELKYKDEVDVVDYVYRKANGKIFYFQSYTIPYFWQDGWEYLFWHRGVKHGLVLPSEENDELLFVIIQKDVSNPLYQDNWHKNTVTKWGTLQSIEKVGTLVVEERINENRDKK